MNLSNIEHSLLQVLLHLAAPVPAELLAMVISRAKPNRATPLRSHPAIWLHGLKEKLPPNLAIEKKPAGYGVARSSPLRDRAAYMRDYRARAGRPSRAQHQGRNI